MTPSRSVALFVALAVAGCVPDFSPFTIVDDAGADLDSGPAPDDAGMDGGRVDAGEIDAGDASPDAGADDAGAGFTPTRIDRACPTAWTDLTASPPAECEGRSVTTVASPFESLAVALGRAIDGTVTVAYNDLEGPDIGRVRTVVFDEDAPASAAAGPGIDPAAAIGDVVGTDLRIATEAPDTHHVALWYRSDFGHEVQLHLLRGAVFDPPVSIATGVGRAGVVDVAVDSDGRSVVAWHDDTSGQNAASRETAGGTFTAPNNLRTDGETRLEGDGAISLVAGEAGAVHAAYQWSITLAASAPSYSVASGTMWSAARTLDNRAIANRASGVGADVALVGTDAIVAYLDWSGGVGEIRFAEVSGAVMPTVTTYLMGVIINDRPGDHPIEIESDANGWLHLLVADAGGGVTSLQYHRQTLVGGELRWISDTIAEMTTTPEQVIVDMSIGPDRRPHIVYWDPTVGNVRYATVAP